MIGAIAVEIFKDFKPSSYEMIKNDYGIYDLTADEENELFGGIMDKDLNNLVPEDFQKGFEDTETSRKNIFLLQLKKENRDRDFHIFEMSGMRRSNYWQLVLGFYCNKNQKNILHLKQQIHLRLS